MLTLPPHCSHTLQPLDRTVYGPLKKFYNVACNAWQLRHPGQTITIYDVAENLGSSYPQAFTPGNITSGFRVSGIWPFNRDIFGDDEYLSAYVTDRPAPVEPAEIENSDNAEIEDSDNATNNDNTDAQQSSTCSNVPYIDDAQPSTSKPVATEDTSDSEFSGKHFSPEEVRPFPKAPMRKTTKSAGKRRAHTQILTDTPVMTSIKEILFQKKQIKSQKSKSKQLPKKTQEKHDEISSDESIEVEYNDGSSDECESLAETASYDGEPTKEKIQKDKYVLVKYCSKKNVTHFVGKIVSVSREEDTATVRFMKRHPSKSSSAEFTFPDVEDVDEIDIEDIVMILPMPISSGGTKRAAKRMRFVDIDLTVYF